jgi:gas vesicle protein
MVVTVSWKYNYRLVWGRTGLDEVLDMLDKTAKRIQKVADETKEATWKQSALYEQIMQAPEASDEQKIKAFIKKARYLDQLETLNSQLSLLYTLQIFAFKVKVMEVTVNNINDQLIKSGVLLKTEELETIKKNIDALKILIEAQYESMKEIRETKIKALDYIK